MIKLITAKGLYNECKQCDKHNYDKMKIKTDYANYKMCVEIKGQIYPIKKFFQDSRRQDNT